MTQQVPSRRAAGNHRDRATLRDRTHGPVGSAQEMEALLPAGVDTIDDIDTTGAERYLDDLLRTARTSCGTSVMTQHANNAKPVCGNPRGVMTILLWVRLLPWSMILPVDRYY
ncbi:MAG TPA: hypothetical protein VGH81_12765 [Rudaea sp.]|jgi:hypothetical protein